MSFEVELRRLGLLVLSVQRHREIELDVGKLRVFDSFRVERGKKELGFVGSQPRYRGLFYSSRNP